MLKPIVIFGLISFSSRVLSLPPPESQDLVKAPADLGMNRQLEAWLKGIPVGAKKADPVAQAILSLRDLRGSIKAQRNTVASSYKLLFDSRLGEGHPLAIYLADELLSQSILLNPEQKVALRNFIEDHGEKSCPLKESILEELDEVDKKILDHDRAIKILALITSFKSRRFLKKALSDYIEVLPDSLRSEVGPDLRLAVVPFDDVINDYKWLQGKADEKMSAKRGYFRSKDLTDVALRRKRCNTARKHLLAAARLDIRQRNFDDIKYLSIKVGRCFRRRGSKARIRYWQGLEKPLKKVYGYKGESFATLKLGSLYWGRDNFAKAIKLHQGVYRKALQLGLEPIQAEALYTLARIYENQGNFKQALSIREKFVKKYPHNDQVPLALKSIVLLSTRLGDVKTALRYNQKIIDSQSILSVDDRDAGVLSFAFFWGGRLLYTEGVLDAAEALWSRGASEYYSSYYGALSHYVLEKSRGYPLALEPRRRKSFSIESLMKDFNVAEKALITRVRHLVSLGFNDAAVCEIEELDEGPEDYRAKLLKSMLFYTTGDWLDAIRIFGALPRTFRHSLTDGTERILFPRAYEGLVNKYAKSLNLDPELIFAIIRQESVFNPRAHSPVGARGLMQLMPRTARLEARRLGRGFVSRKKRHQLIRNTRRSRNSLYDVETNLTLGIHHVRSLMNKYGNPVFILTSYNASPTATSRWRKNLMTDDMLFFIERIPYKETQAYVKLVMRNYFYYKRWYYGRNGDVALLDNLLPEKLKLAFKRHKKSRLKMKM